MKYFLFFLFAFLAFHSIFPREQEHGTKNVQAPAGCLFTPAQACGVFLH